MPYCGMVQFLWQDGLVSVANFVSEGLDIMLGADSDDKSQTSNQPYVAVTDLITHSFPLQTFTVQPPEEGSHVSKG